MYTKTDINGNYKFNNLKAESPIYGNTVIKNVLLKCNDSLHVNVILSSPLFICDYFYWRSSTAYPIGEENHIKIMT